MNPAWEVRGFDLGVGLYGSKQKSAAELATLNRFSYNDVERLYRNGGRLPRYFAGGNCQEFLQFVKRAME